MSAWENPQTVEVIKHTILLVLQFLIGAMLLFNRRPSVAPRNWKEILVPLAASFSFLAYNTFSFLPPSLRENFLPRTLQMPFAVAGLGFGLVGPAVSLWGVLSLGRSFGIFVSVRDVVLHGPYCYVRHPIYLGYFCIWIGLVLANFSVAIFFTVALQTGLFVHRARMEEARLCESSESYREYAKRTGFIFPKLR